MTDSKIAKIRERIRKLLAMAGDASSPNEAAIAAKRAKKLLSEYNLSEADVIAGHMSLDDFQIRHAGRTFARFPTWLNILGPAIGDYTDTHCYFDVIREAPTYAEKKRVMFKGHVDDLMLAEYLFKYLEGTIRKLSAASGLTGRSNKNSFKYGCAVEVCKTLREMAKEEESWFRENSNSKALVLVNKKAAMLQEKFGIVKYKRSSTSVRPNEGLERGKAAGRGISIRRGLSGTSKGPAGLLK